MKRTCSVIFVLASVATNLLATELRDVLAHPEKFQNRRITVVGIARVPGYFFICPDEKAAVKKNPSKALLVRKNNSTQPEYREMDRKWVQVTGVVSDEKRDGYELDTSSFEGHGICLEKIRVLRDRPQLRIKDDTVFGIFKNSMAEPLRVEVVPKSEGGVIFFLKPGDVDETEIYEGRAVASQLEGPRNVSPYKQKVGQPVAAGEITFRSLPSDYEYSDESSEKRRLYFKIIDHQIKRVDVSEGRTWKRP
ncbi:MAG TPA: hypothetical protein VLK27_09155 [Chthoniobacterales bacterium]|nr:hypothetical protein [Chthoniobacterales bacterium]